MKKNKSTRVGVEKGFGPRHAFNAQEGSEAVPSPLPEPPPEDLRIRRNSMGNLRPALMLKALGEELGGLSKEDVAKLGISFLVGGEEMPLGGKGAVPSKTWSSWNKVTNKQVGGPGEIRVDNAGNHYQQVGSHSAGGVDHAIVKPVEAPGATYTTKAGETKEKPTWKNWAVKGPEQFPSLDKPPYDALKAPGKVWGNINDLEGPIPPTTKELQAKHQDWLDAHAKDFEVGPGGELKPLPPKEPPSKQPRRTEEEVRQMEEEATLNDFPLPSEKSKPMSPEEAKYWLEGEPPFEPNVPRYAKGVRHVPKTKTGRPPKIGAAPRFGPRHAENSKEGEDLTQVNTDTVPAMLTPREAVLNRNAAELAGRGKIEALNEEGNALAKKGVDLAGGKAEIGKQKVEMYQGGEGNVPFDPSTWADPGPLPSPTPPPNVYNSPPPGWQQQYASPTPSPSPIQENPFYASQHPYQVVNGLGYDPSIGKYGFGSGEPTRKGIGTAASIAGNALFPGLGFLTGPLARGLWHLVQNMQSRGASEGDIKKAVDDYQQNQGGVDDTGTTPIDTSGGAGRGDKWHDIFGPRSSASGTPGVGVGISPTGAPAVGREWWSPDFGRWDLGASGQGAGNYNLQGPGGWAIGSRGTGFGEHGADLRAAIGWDTLGRAGAGGPSNLNFTGGAWGDDARTHFNPFFGGFSADKQAGGPGVKLRAKGDKDVKANKESKPQKGGSPKVPPYNSIGGGGFYPPGQGLASGTGNVGIGDPDPQAIGANFGAPPQLSAPSGLGDILKARIEAEARKQGLNAGQIQSILGAFKGMGGGAGVGGATDVSGGYYGLSQSPGGYQGGISEVGYPPGISPNAQFSYDRGGWVGAYDPRYSFPGYARGTSAVPDAAQMFQQFRSTR